MKKRVNTTGRIVSTVLPTKESDAAVVAGTEDRFEVVWEFINRRRRQILVNTALYEALHFPLISDSQWDLWAKELQIVQDHYVEIADHPDLPHPEAFKGWTGATGHHLPYRLYYGLAEALLREHRRYLTELQGQHRTRPKK